MPELDNGSGVGGGGAGTTPPAATSSPTSPVAGGLSGGSSTAFIGPTPQNPTALPQWIGAFAGVNTKIKAHAIGDFECVDALNVLIDERTIRMRGGYDTVLNTLTATTWTPHGGIRVYGLNPGTPYDMIAGNFDGVSSIRSSRSGAWATIYSGYTAGPTDYPRVEFVPARTLTENSIYVFFGITGQVPRKITGADVVAAVSWTPVIRPSVGVVHKGRLWVNDVDNPGRVWLSDSGDPDGMRSQTSATIATEGGYITLDIPNGDTIQAMASFGQFIVVFSERSIHFISGTTFSNFAVNPAFNIGTKSPRTVRLCDNDLWFLDSSAIVRFISGSQPNVTSIIAGGIPGYFIESITKAITVSRLGRVCAVYHDRRYWMFHPVSGGSTNERAATWELRELPVPGSRWTTHKCLEAGAAWVTGGAGDSEYIYFLDTGSPILKRFPTGTTDNGAVIEYSYKTRAYDASVPGWEKGLERIAPVTLSYTGSMTLSVYTDLSASAAQTVALTYTGAGFERQTSRRLAAATQGALIQLGVSGTSSVGLEVAGFEFEVTRKRRRGGPG